MTGEAGRARGRERTPALAAPSSWCNGPPGRYCPGMAAWRLFLASSRGGRGPAATGERQSFQHLEAGVRILAESLRWWRDVWSVINVREGVPASRCGPISRWFGVLSFRRGQSAGLGPEAKAGFEPPIPTVNCSVLRSPEYAKSQRRQRPASSRRGRIGGVQVQPVALPTTSYLPTISRQAQLRTYTPRPPRPLDWGGMNNGASRAAGSRYRQPLDPLNCAPKAASWP